ncbi:MAG: FHA domain-containing protein [Candidatus Micrarchaeota archaeon]
MSEAFSPHEAEEVYKRLKMKRYGWLRGKGDVLYTALAKAAQAKQVSHLNLLRLGTYFETLDKLPEVQRQKAKQAFAKTLSHATTMVGVHDIGEVTVRLLQRTAELIGPEVLEQEWFSGTDELPIVTAVSSAPRQPRALILHSAKKLIEFRRSPIVRGSRAILSAVSAYRENREMRKNTVVHADNAIVSPRHAEVFFKDGAIFVRDLHTKPQPKRLEASIGFTPVFKWNSKVETFKLTKDGQTVEESFPSDPSQGRGWVGALYQLAQGHAFGVGHNIFVIKRASPRKVTLVGGIIGATANMEFTFDPRKERRFVIGRNKSCDLRLLEKPIEAVKERERP